MSSGSVGGGVGGSGAAAQANQKQGGFYGGSQHLQGGAYSGAPAGVQSGEPQPGYHGWGSYQAPIPAGQIQPSGSNWQGQYDSVGQYGNTSYQRGGLPHMQGGGYSDPAPNSYYGTQSYNPMFGQSGGQFGGMPNFYNMGQSGGQGYY